MPLRRSFGCVAATTLVRSLIRPILSRVLLHCRPVESEQKEAFSFFCRSNGAPSFRWISRPVGTLDGKGAPHTSYGSAHVVHIFWSYVSVLAPALCVRSRQRSGITQCPSSVQSRGSNGKATRGSSWNFLSSSTLTSTQRSSLHPSRGRMLPH